MGKIVTIRTFFVFLWAFLIATAALAGEQRRTQITIAVDGDDGAQKEFEWHSDSADFAIDELAIGDSKTLTNEDGNEVTVMRTENGLEFEIEGEKIELIDIDVLHDGHEKLIVHEGHEDGNIVIKKHQNVKVIKTDDTSGVTVVSTNEIDDETRKKIKEALGDEAVLFIDGSELSGDEQVHEKREVRIIRKETDVTN